MAGVTPVSVNPSSSIYSAPNTTSQASNAEQSFYFGGNPNLAAITGNKWLIVAAAIAAVAFFLRGRL